MLRDELQEMHRIAARDEKIKDMLAESVASEARQSEATAEEKTTAGPEVPAPLVAVDQTPDGTIHYRKLKPWERVDSRGRVEQYRPMTAAEVEAETEAHFLRGQFKADQAHAAKVQAAVKERDAEQKDMDKRRKQEETTGRRPYNERRFISLEEARRRGYLQSENASSGKPEWWSPGNPHGIMGGGR